MWGLNELIDGKCFDLIVITKDLSKVKYNLGDFLPCNFTIKWHHIKKFTSVINSGMPDVRLMAQKDTIYKNFIHYYIYSQQTCTILEKCSS